MSRVHDALRRSDPSGMTPGARPAAAAHAVPGGGSTDLAGLLEKIEVVPYTPSPEASLIDSAGPREPPAEEFRSLRTRLNHLQTLQPIHTVVITSPSPAEGKSFTSA